MRPQETCAGRRRGRGKRHPEQSSSSIGLCWTDGFAEWEFAARKRRDGLAFGCPGHDGPATTQGSTSMSPLRQRMIEDMTLAGLSPTTQAIYIKAVRGLAAHYHRSPDQISSARRRFAVTCCACVSAVPLVGRSRQTTTASNSCTATRSAVTGRCFQKKDPTAQAEAPAQSPQRCPSP